MTRRILVTGGAGFIGLHLLRRLAGTDIAITVLDSLHPQVHGSGAVAPEFPPNTSFLHGDVRDAAAVARAVSESAPDIVVHLAAETGTGQSRDEVARYCDTNVTGTAHLVEAVRRLPAGADRRRIVLASSRAVYGEGAHRAPDGSIVVPPPRRPEDMAAGRFASMQNGVALTPLPMREDAPPAPASVYASTKLMQEYVTQQALAGSDIDLVILRFQNVYGPGQSLRNPYTGVLSIFCEQILRGQILNIFEDGEIVRDFVFVEDVVDAILAAIDTPDAPGLICNVGSGEAETIHAVAAQLLTLLGASSAGLRISGDFRPGDVRFAVADISLAREHLSWAPKVPLAEGLARLAAWVKSETA